MAGSYDLICTTLAPLRIETSCGFAVHMLTRNVTGRLKMRVGEGGLSMAEMRR
jgi:hypothetical protein